MFDLDLTSLYPSIIMSLNIGKETLIGKIIDVDDRNSRLGLNDLEKLDPNQNLNISLGLKGKYKTTTVGKLINNIKTKKYTISANGTMFATNRQSVLSTILAKWFNERVEYKDKMKEAYKNKDKEAGAKYHLLQYTMKILLNSLYGATALPSFRYGNVNLSKAITLSGQRIIQESAYHANERMNEMMKIDWKTLSSTKIEKYNTTRYWMQKIHYPELFKSQPQHKTESEKGGVAGFDDYNGGIGKFYGERQKYEFDPIVPSQIRKFKNHDFFKK